MPPKTTKKGGEEAVEERRCVNCGRGIKTLFVQYSPGNIRLMKCENCKAVADPYIECEFMIILIDLILHKTKAYRHLLFNMLNLDAGDTKGVFLKSSFVYFLLDACRISLLSNSKDDWDSSGSLLASIWMCGKVLMDVLLGNFIFISVIVLGTRFLLNLSLDISRYKVIILAILISSYFKLFLIAMMVWEFPSSVLFIIDIFVLSSNAVALRGPNVFRCEEILSLSSCRFRMPSVVIRRRRERKTESSPFVIGKSLSFIVPESSSVRPSCYTVADCWVPWSMLWCTCSQIVYCSLATASIIWCLCEKNATHLGKA